ncbi:hypothetical protein EJ571_20575 [Mycobacteroides franklinii]|uniref:Uncharacterized protein n=1 Tax=Mycobacteroides franklinii TaxID=948102 RepID=A0A4R5P6A9_9MYCO|nr:hypothetical protein BST24_08555 [Mycobacteroides franklinii]TDH18980.1 hypothetical protein EJ571_20575 [Mycobacteroides franklinii]
MTALPVPCYGQTHAHRQGTPPRPWFTFQCQRCGQDFRARFIARECRDCWEATSAIYPTLWPGTGEASGS